MWYNELVAHIRPTERHDLQLGARGRLVLPARVRRRLGFREGDRMILMVEPDGSLRLVSLRDQVRKLKGAYKHLAPGVSLAKELIRERRQEARRENRA